MRPIKKGLKLKGQLGRTVPLIIYNDSWTKLHNMLVVTVPHAKDVSCAELLLVQVIVETPADQGIAQHFKKF